MNNQNSAEISKVSRLRDQATRSISVILVAFALLAPPVFHIETIVGMMLGATALSIPFSIVIFIDAARITRNTESAPDINSRLGILWTYFCNIFVRRLPVSLVPILISVSGVLSVLLIDPHQPCGVNCLWLYPYATAAYAFIPMGMWFAALASGIAIETLTKKYSGAYLPLMVVSSIFLFIGFLVIFSGDLWTVF